MAWIRKILRTVIFAALIIAIGVPVLTYIVLSTPWAQEKLRSIGEQELSAMLDTPVEIGRVDYRPFNTIAISSVAIRDSQGQKAVGVGRISARFELGYFLRTGRLVFDYAVLDAPEINVYRDSKDSPLNVQPILERFKKKDNQKPPASFDLKIATIILRHGSISYNVFSEPASPGRFNPNHILLNDFNLHAYLRHAANDDLDAAIETLSFKEQSGFELSDLIVDLAVGPNGTSLRDFEIELPESRFSLRPIRLNATSFNELDSIIRVDGITIATSEPSVISTADLASFSPVFSKLDITARLEISAFASQDDYKLNYLTLETDDGIKADIRGGVRNGEGNMEIRDIETSGNVAARIASIFTAEAAKYIERISSFKITGLANFSNERINGIMNVNIGSGTANIHCDALSSDKFKSGSFSSNIEMDNIQVGKLLADSKFGELSAQITAEGTYSGKNIEGDAEIDILSAGWNGHIFKEVGIEATYARNHAELRVTSPDSAANFNLDAAFSEESGIKHLLTKVDIHRFAPEELGLRAWRPGFETAMKINANLCGANLNDISGSLNLNDISLYDNGASLKINEFTIKVNRESDIDYVYFTSDFLNGSIEGEINPTSIPTIFTDMASHIVPDLVAPKILNDNSLPNIFVADLTLDHMVPICDYLHLPVTVIYPVDILASVDSEKGAATLSLDAPYLKQGDKIIDATVVGASLSTADDRLAVYASSHMPTKKGPMSLALGITGSQNRFDTRLDWEIEREIPINGVIDLSTLLDKSDDGSLAIDTHFNPGQINFGDDVWNIHPSSIAWHDKIIDVNKFTLSAGQQMISINGRGSESPDDFIDVALHDITMISIFETLEIENAMIGGTANGNFKASQILSKVPVITTDDLHVDSISYNHCVIGTADVTARWDNEKQSVFLDADIVNPEGLPSHIYGDIFVAKESLDLYFDANHVRVGFMQPFMAAFASEVSGYGSGTAHLFGTFHDIDMAGDLFADDVKLKIDFTNTVYSATDSVHITPGIINLKDITIRDVNGNTAKINGVLTHEYFHLPRFNFQITDAKDFLCYNITEAMNPDWYGTIYGNGSASVVGHPGVIEIGANMSTAPGTTFTFVLSDRLEAEQYSFITFNDVTELTAEEKLAADDTPDDVKEYIERINRENIDRPSDYRLDFRVDVTPDAQMILVMDPVGGDRIRAVGSGDMRLTYNSSENDIRMYGTYTLDRGSYNFTLQDIIIKDFTIDPGSSITFRGDPYSATLNIEAAYQLNASLTDLDESFAMDKDLNRTNVPVQALMKVSGDMRQPDLDFDLRFPTLTSDTYRKVRSIISTDDMMNRQIIYLLALNRFYTPDYMDGATKGSELFSVASSTISSQLSNILGKLSDKWSIAPNLRSDRGDFSDIEVDVALSSRLLNNRLLLNGNLGYRDKSLNTNQFIGDFDIEYLLTRTGNWRLKGYSRYNDQNYYVRTAPTTQGVGIMFRRDFDSLFPRRKNTAPTSSITEFSDSTSIESSQK